jgi:hypothetical protein
VSDQRREVGVGQGQLERAALKLGERDDLVDDPDQLVERTRQLVEELGALLIGHRRVLQDVGDPLGHGHRRAELMRDVREEVGLGGGALRDVVAQGGQLALELARAVHRSRQLARQQPGDLSRQRHGAGGGAADRAERILDRILLQHVAGGTRCEDLGHPHGVTHHRVRHEPRRRRGGEEPLHELRPAQPLQGELRDDHVRPGADDGLDAAEGVGRDLDLEVVLAQQVVLEASDLVGRVAEQHRDGHLSGISAPRGGG